MQILSLTLWVLEIEVQQLKKKKKKEEMIDFSEIIQLDVIFKWSCLLGDTTNSKWLIYLFIYFQMGPFLDLVREIANRSSPLLEEYQMSQALDELL